MMTRKGYDDTQGLIKALSHANNPNQPRRARAARHYHCVLTLVCVGCNVAFACGFPRLAEVVRKIDGS